jgi:hypothetical protein
MPWNKYHSLERRLSRDDSDGQIVLRSLQKVSQKSYHENVFLKISEISLTMSSTGLLSVLKQGNSIRYSLWNSRCIDNSDSLYLGSIL